MDLNTQRAVVLRYDIIPVLKSIIKLGSIPLINNNIEDVDCIKPSLSYIQQVIIMGAEENMCLGEISEQIYKELNLDKQDEVEKDKIEQTLINNAIILTQKNILQWHNSFCLYQNSKNDNPITKTL